MILMKLNLPQKMLIIDSFLMQQAHFHQMEQNLLKPHGILETESNETIEVVQK